MDDDDDDNNNNNNNNNKQRRQQIRKVRLIACTLTLKVKLILPTFPQASYVSPTFRLIPFLPILC
jgi:hypothetical protein